MLEMRVNQMCAGETFVNTFNFTGVDANAGNANAIATALVNTWTSGLLSRLATTWQINSVQYREYPAQSNSPFLTANIVNLPVVGTSDETTMLATHTALRVNTLNNVSAPYSGHYFLGGFADSTLTLQGTWGAGTLSAILAHTQAMLDIGTTLGLDVALGIRSRGTATITADTTSVVNVFEISANPASLDSRRKDQGI